MLTVWVSEGPYGILCDSVSPDAPEGRLMKQEPQVQSKESPVNIFQHHIQHPSGTHSSNTQSTTIHLQSLMDLCIINGCALPCCVAVGKYLYLSEPQFSVCKEGQDYLAYRNVARS